MAFESVSFCWRGGVGSGCGVVGSGHQVGQFLLSGTVAQNTEGHGNKQRGDTCKTSKDPKTTQNSDMTS